MKNTVALLFVIIALAFPLALSAQDKPESDQPKDSEVDEAIRAKAVEMLRETAQELTALRTAENRISFSSDLANLMWLHDEQQAKGMFRRVTDDFVQLLTSYNSRVVALGGARDNRNNSGVFTPFNPDPDARTLAVKQMMKAMQVRQKIAISIGEFDAESAYSFTVRTSNLVTDEFLAQRFKDQNERVEQRILQVMKAEDVDSMLAFGKKSLERGYKRGLLDLAQKIAAKDEDEGKDFAADIMSKVISDAEPTNKSITAIYALLNSNEKGSAEDALFSKDQRRELARTLGNTLLRTDKDYETYMSGTYVETIKEFDPGLANRVKRKLIPETEEGPNRKRPDLVVPGSGDFPSPARIGEDGNRPKSPLQELLEISEESKGKELTKEQKAEFIGRAREIISKIDRPTMKITALSGLALQVNKLGDKELAKEIMNEAAPFVNQQPKHYMDYMTLWTFVQGASAVDPDTAFNSLEEAIFRLSDTMDAFVRVAEFIDVGNDFVIDKELQLGTFGGGIVQGFVAQARAATPVMRNLAEADFDRTRALANKFEQPEIRILAKLIILKSILDRDAQSDSAALFRGRSIFG